MRVRVGIVLAVVAALAAPAGAGAAQSASCLSFSTSVVAKARTVGEEARRSVLYLESTDTGGAGTAWVLSRGGLIMTNDHVVRGSTSFTAWLPDGRGFAAHVVASTPAPDVALLQLESPPADLAPLPTGSSASLKRLQPLVQVGHPGEVGHWIVALGAHLSARPAFKGGGRELASTVPGRRGNSGSPLLDLEGKVVGLVWGGAGGAVLRPDRSPRPESKALRTLLTPRTQTLAVPIEEALAVRRFSALARVVAGGVEPAKRKPRRPPPPGATVGDPVHCLPRQGQGFDAATIDRGQAIADAVRGSVVSVDIGLGRGTGWFVSSNLVVTNNHVVEDAGAGLAVWTLAGKRYPARIVGRTAKPDLAFLRVEGAPGIKPLPLGSASGLQPQQPLVTVGHPGEVGNWVATVGRFLRFREGFTSAGSAVREIESSVPGMPGSSGSPVLDLTGNVVGVVFGGAPQPVRPVGQGPTPSPGDVRTFLTIPGGASMATADDVLELGRTLGVLP